MYGLYNCLYIYRCCYLVGLYCSCAQTLPGSGQILSNMWLWNTVGMGRNPLVSDLHITTCTTDVFLMILWWPWRGQITISMDTKGTAGLNHSWSGACWTPGSEPGVSNCLSTVGVNGCVLDLHIAPYHSLHVLRLYAFTLNMEESYNFIHEY